MAAESSSGKKSTLKVMLDVLEILLDIWTSGKQLHKTQDMMWAKVI